MESDLINDPNRKGPEESRPSRTCFSEEQIIGVTR
jgi:hypothetical protein